MKKRSELKTRGNKKAALCLKLLVIQAINTQNTKENMRQDLLKRLKSTGTS